MRPALPLALVLLTGCSPGVMPRSLPHALAGGQAPEFHEVSTSDRDVGVPGSARTRATVIDFWASWCVSCRETIPAFEDLYQDRRDDGVMVIGVSVDESREDALAVANALHANFPIVHDPRMAIAGRYGVAQVPLTFVVDRRGTVRWVGRDPAEARQAAEVLLAE